ncbi:MAG: hypothetical protein Q8O38_14790 [Sulfurimicrobium sp.]|nr:hypothetical protein [Sulfurimicrobium sp.]
MKHFASSKFWQRFDMLPASIQQLARDSFALLKQNPSHPSLQFNPDYPLECTRKERRPRRDSRRGRRSYNGVLALMDNLGSSQLKTAHFAALV